MKHWCGRSVLYMTAGIILHVASVVGGSLIAPRYPWSGERHSMEHSVMELVEWEGGAVKKHLDNACNGGEGRLSIDRYYFWGADVEEVFCPLPGSPSLTSCARSIQAGWPLRSARGFTLDDCRNTTIIPPITDGVLTMALQSDPSRYIMIPFKPMWSRTGLNVMIWVFSAFVLHSIACLIYNQRMLASP
jgi:hypothetical protein